MTNQYYYSDCMSWHDEGTGPYSDARKNDAYAFSWRIKPSPPEKYITLHSLANSEGKALTIETHGTRYKDNSYKTYIITGFTSAHPSGLAADPVVLNFQNGHPKDVGINGITLESLIAILCDRLEDLQDGDYAHEQNRLALNNLKNALAHLKLREIGQKKASWNDARVQAVYEILACDLQPTNPAEHWEGYLARKIVSELDKFIKPIDTEKEVPSFAHHNWPIKLGATIYKL